MPTTSLTTLLIDTASAWNIQLTSTHVEQLRTYQDELQRWNAHTNLTAITSSEDIIRRHFLDSLRCATSWGASLPHTLVDVGSGAGFPGIPLKIAFPALHITLIESVAKKVAFLTHIAETLKLNDVTILHARAETVGHQPPHREAYDVAIARAVASLPVLAEYCLPLLRIGGRMLAPKGASITDEVAAANTALARLGGQIIAIEPVTIPQLEPRTLVVIEKTVATPGVYPRRPGTAVRKPL
ncbi:MAG: 16S rRNA (guanine(527)-N(7))-methyltransferase RsmG [Chloroflexaceae bacterium]|nr:16S rRNA (guanine(527)-N(7))-methyltransferase RsmG [Chloroflexaceae bacterium]